MKRQTIIIILGYIFIAICFGACESQKKTSKIIHCNIREVIKNPQQFDIKKDIKKISYVPLETSDSSLIGNILDLVATKDFLFILDSRTGCILQYGMNGKFIRQVSKVGNGPEEYGMINEIAVNSYTDKLYVFLHNGETKVFNTDGSLSHADTTFKYTGKMHLIDSDNIALKGLVFNPKIKAPWAGAIKKKNGDIIAKSIFPKNVSEDLCFMKNITFSPTREGVLLHTPTNDTIFRITATSIEPTYILDTNNPKNYYDDIADYSKLSDRSVENDNCIEVYNYFFETPSHLYLRCYKGENDYIIQVNRKTNEVKANIILPDYIQLSGQIPGNNIIGIENTIDRGAPIFPEFYVNKNTYAQVISYDQVNGLKEKGYLKNAPAELDIDENNNPIVILYTLLD